MGMARQKRKLQKVVAKKFRLDFDTYSNFINTQMPLRHRIKFALAVIFRSVSRKIFED